MSLGMKGSGSGSQNISRGSMKSSGGDSARDAASGRNSFARQKTIISKVVDGHAITAHSAKRRMTIQVTDGVK